jgi:hypothetical protein
VPLRGFGVKRLATFTWRNNDDYTCLSKREDLRGVAP